jgi:hypothetical protein
MTWEPGLPVVISIYDESGNMLRPWAEAGFDCYCLDIVNVGHSERVGKGWLHFVKADVLDPEVRANIIALKPVFIAGFPPCTDLAGLGAKHWAGKLERNPNYVVEAMALVYFVRDVADELGVPYFAENPVGRISTEWRKPCHIFNPCEYGGYLPEDDAHPRWPEYIEPRDAYTKKTCLWTGNGFVMPWKKPVPPVMIELESSKASGVVRGSKQWAMLGGKSAKTKQIRSETPRGFAIACFHFNGLPILRRLGLA